MRCSCGSLRMRYTTSLACSPRRRANKMTIDKTGKWWVGSDEADLEEYLKAYSADGYITHEFRLANCPCGSASFLLWADDGEGTAKRICSLCNSIHYLCDSEEYWTEETSVEWKCVECGSKLANIGVGFSLYEDGEVRWLYVGERCTQCGVMGCAAQWKVAYIPSKQLIEQV